MWPLGVLVARLRAGNYLPPSTQSPAFKRSPGENSRLLHKMSKEKAPMETVCSFFHYFKIEMKGGVNGPFSGADAAKIDFIASSPTNVCLQVSGGAGD